MMRRSPGMAWRSDRWRQLVVATFVLAAVVIAAAASPRSSPAIGATTMAARTKNAYVVIDTGERVVPVRIQFVTPVNGYQALGIAGGETIRAGDTVCQLLGVGPDHDQCVAGAPSSWTYFRAKAESNRWKAMTASPTTVRVRDGDVEGWRFGSSKPPRVDPDKVRRTRAGAGS
jgi:hypothetical protein